MRASRPGLAYPLLRRKRTAKRGQHHNDAVDTAKPRRHETSRGRNHPDRSEPIATGTYKKRETYAKQASARSGNTSDRRRQATPEDFDAFGLDIRESPAGGEV